MMPMALTVDISTGPFTSSVISNWCILRYKGIEHGLVVMVSISGQAKQTTKSAEVNSASMPFYRRVAGAKTISCSNHELNRQNPT